jgi:hypothetical protein
LVCSRDIVSKKQNFAGVMRNLYHITIKMIGIMYLTQT